MLMFFYTYVLYIFLQNLHVCIVYIGEIGFVLITSFHIVDHIWFSISNFTPYNNHMISVLVLSSSHTLVCRWFGIDLIAYDHTWGFTTKFIL